MSSQQEAPQAGMITTEQAGRLLMVTGERVRQLIKSGYVPRPVKGVIPLVAAVQGYIKFLKDEDRRSSKSAADSRVRDARAKEIELKIARQQRELLPTEEAVALCNRVVGLLISRVAGLPAEFTRDLNERRRLEGSIDAIRVEVADLIREYRLSLPVVGNDHPAGGEGNA
ncbi:hypothetical protein [Rhodopseudomonas faecalis]|uniref:hypothetical protein n=1 Tax=Rhodopseudomonas faecalis TaxID=99655 RepID=UPI001FDF7805|nr:hypothetical protein [Rhodopseudomonas faecalis]